MNRYYNEFSDAYKKSNSMYTYYAADGSKETIAAGTDGVTEDWIAQIKAWHREERSMLRHGEGKILSLDDFNENSHGSSLVLADRSIDIERDLIAKTEREEFMQKLQSVIQEMTPQQFEIFTRAYIRGESASILAREKGITEGAVRDRLRKILKKVQKRLI